MKDKKSYGEAMERLNSILESIDESEVPIDELADKVTEASDLLKTCKGILGATEAKVKNVLDSLDKDFGAESEG